MLLVVLSSLFLAEEFHARKATVNFTDQKVTLHQKFWLDDRFPLAEKEIQITLTFLEIKDCQIVHSRWPADLGAIIKIPRKCNVSQLVYQLIEPKYKAIFLVISDIFNLRRFYSSLFQRPIFLVTKKVVEYYRKGLNEEVVIYFKSQRNRVLMRLFYNVCE